MWHNFESILVSGFGGVLVSGFGGILVSGHLSEGLLELLSDGLVLLLLRHKLILKAVDLQQKLRGSQSILLNVPPSAA